MAFIFPFNENAPSREDGEKLENIGDRVFYFFCGLSLSFGFSTCCLRNFKVKQFSSSEAVIFYNIFLVFRFDW